MLTDSHCHLDFPDFDLPRVMARCANAGVTRIVIPAVAQWNWARIAALCAADSRCHAAYGLHPLYLDDHREAHIDELEQWLAAYPAVAIGECGLDYFVELPRARQQWFFEAQLELARRLDLPVIIHARRSLDAVLHTMKRFPGLRFVVHSFTGSDQQLAQLFALGGIIGIGGTCTYPRASRLRRQIAALQAGQYMLETDAPDQPLFGRQGQINEPWLTAEVAAAVATLTGALLADVIAASSATADKFYKWENFS
ncbi:MAG: TatD family hydrolase [Cardiobacteriaceae bacterium]|nr:TatD family hydrolase [Cardiobacteriaceae bacterium]